MTKFEVNTNTYVMPDESDVLLAEVLPTSNPLRITWGVLEASDKKGYLSAGLRKLENMTFIGKRVSYFQPLKFPRIAKNIPADFTNAPIEVKRAQVLLAVEIMREELYIKRRNTDACISLGLIKDETNKKSSVEVEVKELLHKWLSSWRKV
jgi:hypothetical protein